MAIPTNEEILSALGRLDSKVADDLESQWLELKPWQGSKEDMKVAVEYAACFANAEGGVVVFGVADRTRGRAKAIHGAAGYDLDVWRRGPCWISFPSPRRDSWRDRAEPSRRRTTCPKEWPRIFWEGPPTPGFAASTRSAMPSW
jgi:hypothetical protein